MIPRCRGPIRNDATGKFSSRCPFPALSPAASLILPRYCLAAALPHAALTARELYRGINGEGCIKNTDQGERNAPKGRSPIEVKYGLEDCGHTKPRQPSGEACL